VVTNPRKIEAEGNSSEHCAAGRAPLLQNISFLLKIALLPAFPHPALSTNTFSVSVYAVSSSSA